MNLTAIRAELGQLLEQIGGVRVYLQAEDSVYASTATAQALVIRDGSPYVDYYAEGAMKGGQSLVRMVVEIVPPRTSMRDAEREFGCPGAGPRGQPGSQPRSLKKPPNQPRSPVKWWMSKAPVSQA